MTVQQVTDLKTPIGEILKAAGPDGVVLKAAGQPGYAVIPLDDELIDYLIERSPKFIQACEAIRRQMQAGQYKIHEEVKKLLGSE